MRDLPFLVGEGTLCSNKIPELNSIGDIHEGCLPSPLGVTHSSDRPFQAQGLKVCLGPPPSAAGLLKMFWDSVLTLLSPCSCGLAQSSDDWLIQSQLDFVP